MPLLRLIRWKNLLIIFFTQLLAWACVLLPLQRYATVPLLLTPLNFLCISLSTVLIAAAGYIINDYFDIKIDIINRPEKMVLEKRIPRKWGIIFHTALNLVGLALAAYVARQAGHYEWLFLQLCCTLLLWFYSASFKRRFMIGNVVVSLLTALTIITLIVYEPAIHIYFHKPTLQETSLDYLPMNPLLILGMFTFFAFILTWMREIVKDMEDYKGDSEDGCITMPIKWGLQKSGRFSIILGITTIIALLISAFNLAIVGWLPVAIYIVLAVIYPLTMWISNINKKATVQHYALASKRLKVIMLLGLGSLLFYYLWDILWHN